MGFREIAPGVLVNENSIFSVSIPHPDPCWVISNPEETALISTESSLLVFSNEEKLHFFMDKKPKTGYLPKEYAWDCLVDEFGKQYSEAIVDHNGEPGFYQTVLLRKGI